MNRRCVTTRVAAGHAGRRSIHARINGRRRRFPYALLSCC
jgi:hypothetical protein